MKQWEILKSCDGKTVNQFYEIAMNYTFNEGHMNFMEGEWWKGEIEWCLRRSLISLKEINT